MRPTSKGPCKLERGEMRRVSQDRRFGLVGYHVCCPRCGYVTVALNGSDGMVITETGDRRGHFLRAAALPLLPDPDRRSRRPGALEEDEHVRRRALPLTPSW